MTITSFEDYLQQIHAEDYQGTDDDMSDAYESWLMDLDINELLLHAEKAIIIARHEGVIEGLEKGEEIAFKVLRGTKS